MKSIRLLFLVFAIVIALFGANQLLISNDLPARDQLGPNYEYCQYWCVWPETGKLCWQNCQLYNPDDHCKLPNEQVVKCSDYCGENPCK